MTRTSGGVTTTFHFSGSSITTEKQGSSIVAHYVYGVNRVSRDANNAFEYYHNDGLGSTRQLSNDSQSVTQTTTYDAFGRVASETGSSNNVYKYAGQWGYRNDGDDGLMHVGARYYDPLVGRFLQADRWLGTIGIPQSLNRYVYCMNDPVNFVDPTGHLPWLILAIVVAAVLLTPSPAEAPTGEEGENGEDEEGELPPRIGPAPQNTGASGGAVPDPPVKPPIRPIEPWDIPPILKPGNNGHQPLTQPDEGSMGSPPDPSTYL